MLGLLLVAHYLLNCAADLRAQPFGAGFVGGRKSKFNLKNRREK